MFSRQPHGSVRPVDAKPLAATEEQIEEISKFLPDVFDKSMDLHEVVQSGKSLKEKPNELEQAKPKAQDKPSPSAR
jgi:hypothetical protein